MLSIINVKILISILFWVGGAKTMLFFQEKNNYFQNKRNYHKNSKEKM